MAQNAWTGLSQSTAHLPALGMGMMQMKENQSNKDAALGLAAERNALAQQHEARMEEQARLQTEAARANIPQHRKVFNPSLVPQVSVAIEKAYGKHGLAAMQPVLGTAKEAGAANPESTFGDVYEATKSAYPAHREEMMGSIEKALASGKLSEIEQKRLSALYDAIVYDKTGDRVLGEGVFKNTARSMKMEEENSKAAIEAAKVENKGTWSEPYSLNGAMVQKNSATREVRQSVSRPPVGDGGSPTAQMAKHEKLVQSFEKQADTEASRETRMKFNINPTMEQGPDGKIRMVWPNNPEATQYYLKKRQELTDKRISRAVKNKALPKEYAPEAAGAPNAGDVVDGYRFKGGNPGVPGNWEKVN